MGRSQQKKKIEKGQPLECRWKKLQRTNKKKVESFVLSSGDIRRRQKKKQIHDKNDVWLYKSS